MKTRRAATILATLCLTSCAWWTWAAMGGATPPAAGSGRPRLVLLIAVDQMRYDYLTRFRDRFKGGLKRLLDQGAVFTNANLEHYPTVTAVGHATMLSGATPALSGIVVNDWYDRETSMKVPDEFDPGPNLPA